MSYNDDEASAEILFEYDYTTVGVLPTPTLFNIFQKPSSSKAQLHFGLTSSL